MAKFQVDLPEDPEEGAEETAGSDRASFSFRDAEPVGVGSGADVPKSEAFDARQHVLAASISVALKAHERLQAADLQVHSTCEWMSELKNGASIEENKGLATKMVDVIRAHLISTMVSLDYILLTLHLDEEGRLGKHDTREYARLGMAMLERIREEYERWGVPTDDVDAIPQEALDLMRAAAEAMEKESEE